MARGPDRPGFFRSLPLPGRTEALLILALLVVTAVAVGAAAWHASNRKPPPFQPPEAAGISASASARPTAPPTSGPPVLAFYGDWYVSGTRQGGMGPAGWPAIVSARIGAEGTPPHAVPGAGYVAASGDTSDTFVTLAERAPEPTADVTVVFGGRNDYRAGPGEITAAATRTFDAIRAAAPETRLLVIGPAWTDAAVPPQLPPIRDAVREAATASGATFVDPLAERWFFDNPELISADAISPTDAGHVYLADRIEPVVRELLDRPAATSAATDPTH